MCIINNPPPSVILEEGRIIGYGATSDVYLLPGGAVCKVFHPEFSIREIQRESCMAESAYRLGLRVPRPGGIVRAGDSVGILSEYVEGECLADILSKNPGRFCELFPRYLRELRRFHETKAASGDFVSAKALYLEKIRALYGSDWYSPEELEKMERLVRSVPDRDTLIYGDYHPKNILVKNGELFFVDLGDICLGHPVFDFAMIANTHFIIPSANPSYAEKYFAVPPELMLELWSELFQRYFSGISSERQNTVRRGIMAFAVLRQGLSPADGRVFPEPVLKGNVAAARKRLLPEIDSVIGSIDW